MSFDPITNASMYIQIHAVCAIAALLLGPIALYRRKRDRIHKYVGYVWMTAMTTTAITSFWIREINADGSLSPVHILAITAICTIVYSVWSVRNGNLRAHKASLRNLYFFGTAGALTFNFLPNRTIPKMFFDGGSFFTFCIAASIITIVVLSLHTLSRNRI